MLDNASLNLLRSNFPRGQFFSTKITKLKKKTENNVKLKILAGLKKKCIF